MFCTDCGRKFEGNYCPYCGLPIIELRGGVTPAAAEAADEIESASTAEASADAAEAVTEAASTPTAASAPAGAYPVRRISSSAVTALFIAALALGAIGLIATLFILS